MAPGGDRHGRSLLLRLGASGSSIVVEAAAAERHHLLTLVSAEIELRSPLP